MSASACRLGFLNAFTEYSAAAAAPKRLAVKNNFCVKDTTTTCGSMMLKNFVSPYDATCVRLLKESGWQVVGKTNLDEFAMGAGGIDSRIHGATENPWQHPKLFPSSNVRIAGGSSSGSAVSVATGLADVALGSDTGGSARCPAALCGVYGFKPSYGSVSRHGLISLVNSLDCPSLLSRDISKIRDVFSTICVRDADRDSTSVDVQRHAASSNKDRFVVGVPRAMLAVCKDDVAREFEEFCHYLSHRSDLELIDIDLPNMRHGVTAYSVICCSEVASNMARFDGMRYGYQHRDVTDGDCCTFVESLIRCRSDGFNDVVKGRILAGNYFNCNSNRYLEQAFKVRRLICRDYEDAFKNVDFILTPSVPTGAMNMDEFVKEDNRTRITEMDVFLVSTNFAGLPSISLPSGGMDLNGCPVGVLITGRFGADFNVLNFISLLNHIPDSYYQPLDNAINDFSQCRRINERENVPL